MTTPTDAELLRLCDEAIAEIRDAGMSQIDADADGCCPICNCAVHDDGDIEPDEASRCHSCAHDIVARVAGWSPLVSAARESVRLRAVADAVAHWREWAISQPYSKHPREAALIAVYEELGTDSEFRECSGCAPLIAESVQLRADVARLREALSTLHETACGVHPQWDSAQEKQYVYDFNVARNAAQEALAATDPERKT
jgi:hypothetical protein